MPEKLYLVQRETLDEYGDVVDSRDLLTCDTYDYARDFVGRSIMDFPLEDNEQISISAVEETDGEIDYENADLLWVSI